MSTLRQLFDGAITAELPDALVDASTVRQVPDTQEVFFSPTSDVSYIIEILQRVEPDDPTEAAKFHFDSLAHDNDALSSSVSSVIVPDDYKPDAPGTPSPILLDGSQKVTKFNRQTPDDVRILLAVYRVASKGVDIVLSANLPIAKETGGGLTEADFNIANDAFLNAARSLKIIDFGLFN
ncbi:Mog1p/PsbP-like protein [Fomitiporia mediterranea MF3/22]|uniref:Mog1p/PsbP-like protein n=1 Tax=Fomitiporia mediterranea (strain MF3/22) TaxID=694068 RepID=UPI0004407FCA|nr:Mog1p/PsbP-like protein [Fomitiporia mediterranea MF3/22]EJD05999.1 Mog1p/PsbP-like protein [Fomitiporia mediterranea MF3/22]